MNLNHEVQFSEKSVPTEAEAFMGVYQPAFKVHLKEHLEKVAYISMIWVLCVFMCLNWHVSLFSFEAHFKLKPEWMESYIYYALLCITMRPRKRRMVDFEHPERQFRPFSPESEISEEILLTIDELEAMRLSFLENLSQTEAAARMEIHQSTFQRALKKALEKVTDALVHGKAIRIEGGDYRMPRGDGTGPAGQGPAGGGRGRGQGKGRGGRFGGPEGNCICTACGYETPHTPGVSCSQVKCEKCGSPMVRK